MARKKNTKIIPWTQQEEETLLKNVEKHVFNLNAAFKQTSKEIQRTTTACSAHWYSKTSIHGGKCLFLTVAGTEVLVNRTRKSKKAPSKKSSSKLFQRILNLFKL